jgi:hypothetical protein
VGNEGELKMKKEVEECDLSFVNLYSKMEFETIQSLFCINF